jgi:tetratricopeptide (TPR) repeat protein
VWPVAALAHGPPTEQIVQITRRIEQEPRNASLYLKRDELHRIQRDWAAALADYRQTRRLDPALDIVDFCEGRMLLEAGSLDAATFALRRYLSRHPDDPEALWTRGRVEAGLGRPEGAAEDYTRALARLPQPKPEHFIERSRALAAAGHNEQAIAGLDAGIQRLGPLVTLEVPAIDFELTLKRYDAALGRVARMLEHSPRKEPWLARRGEILALAGRHQEARAAYADALQAVEALPSRIRTTKAMRELERQCRKEIGR